MGFSRWDPLHDLLAIQRLLERTDPGTTGASAAGWSPAVDLVETADAYVLHAELPGIGRSDVQIEIHDGRLTLAGSRPARAHACETYHRVERGHGTFRRTFQLPLPVDADRITADLRDGVLTVVCPKTPVASTRRVRIS